MSPTIPANNQQLIAKDTVIVHDDQLNIDRKVIVGQPVPPDLVEAYKRATGDTEGNPAEPTAAPDPAAESATTRRGKGVKA